MITADVVVLIISVVSVALGGLLGFGKGLKVFTKGIFGTIISVVVCYFIYGIVLDWAFVGKLLDKFHNYLVAKDNLFCDILVKIRIDMVVFFVALFVVVTLVRVFLVNLVCELMCSDNKAVKIANKLLGIVLFLIMAFAIMLIAFQILTISDGFGAKLDGSVFGLDKLYRNNPLMSIIEGFKK